MVLLEGKLAPSEKMCLFIAENGYPENSSVLCNGAM